MLLAFWEVFMAFQCALRIALQRTFGLARPPQRGQRKYSASSAALSVKRSPAVSTLSPRPDGIAAADHTCVTESKDFSSLAQHTCERHLRARGIAYLQMFKQKSRITSKLPRIGSGPRQQSLLTVFASFVQARSEHWRWCRSPWHVTTRSAGKPAFSKWPSMFDVNT